jgi:enamine deaminase RidA (YjgF/YER057c/UK114 family)
MAGEIERRLTELGIVLPEPAAAAANYVPFVVSGNTVYVSGQLPITDGKITIAGKVGDDVSVDQAQAAARLVALNILAQVKAAAGGDLDRIRRCVKLGGFVNAAPDFTDHPKVINGASDLMGEVLGERGRHARFAAGAGSLPFNAAVEIDAVFEIS